MPDPTASTAGPADASPSLGASDRLVIYLMLVATFVVILNETIIGVAIPRLMDDLSVEASTAQWLSTGFMLTMAVVIPITGFLIQRFTTRSVFIAAMSLFSAGTAIAALAPGFPMLLMGRIVQASGTAIMLPLLMTTVMTLVPPQQRGRMMGNITIVISVAPAIGPTISGLILNSLSWRWLFLLVLPIALAALALGAAKVRNVGETRPGSVDVVSIVLSAFAFGGLVFGLSSIGEAAGGNALVSPWIPLLVGGVTLLAFVLRQLRLQHQDRALLDLRTLSSGGFTISVLIMVVAMAALFGTVIITPIYTVDVLGLSELQTGLILLPGALLMGLLGPVVGRVYDKVGPRPLVVPGAIALSVVMWLMALLLTESTAWWVVLVLQIGVGMTLATLFTPLFTSSLGALQPKLYSHGSAVIGTTQQLAGAAGTALFVALLTIGSTNLTEEGAAPTAALAGGVHWAFVAGAIISLFGILPAFFVRRPASELAHGGPVAHGPADESSEPDAEPDAPGTEPDALPIH